MICQTAGKLRVCRQDSCNSHSKTTRIRKCYFALNLVLRVLGYPSGAVAVTVLLARDIALLDDSS